MARTRKTTAEVADLIRNGKRIPTTVEVENHAIRFYPRHWLNRWDKNMPLIPSVFQSGEKDSKVRLTLSRGDLFTLGNKVETEQDAVNFYVAVCSWGACAKARWSPSEYGEYLELINNAMEHLPEAERSDCLEMRLFNP